MLEFFSVVFINFNSPLFHFLLVHFSMLFSIGKKSFCFFLRRCCLLRKHVGINFCTYPEAFIPWFLINENEKRFFSAVFEISPKAFFIVKAFAVLLKLSNVEQSPPRRIFCFNLFGIFFCCSLLKKFNFDAFV